MHAQLWQGEKEKKLMCALFFAVLVVSARRSGLYHFPAADTTGCGHPPSELGLHQLPARRTDRHRLCPTGTIPRRHPLRVQVPRLGLPRHCHECGRQFDLKVHVLPLAGAAGPLAASGERYCRRAGLVGRICLQTGYPARCEFVEDSGSEWEEEKQRAL